MRSHGIAKSLTERGADLFCLTKPGFPFDLNRYQDEYDRLARMDIVEGVDYHRVAQPRQRDFPRHPCDITAHASIQYLERAVDAFVDKFTEVRPSCVVAASNFVVALPAAIAARNLGLPFVYEVRGFWEITHISRDATVEASFQYRLQVELESRTAAACDHVFTLATPMAEELVRRGVSRERISLLPNSCNPEHFQPRPRDAELAKEWGIPGGVPVIGYIGSYPIPEVIRGINSAYIHAKKVNPDVQFKIVWAYTWFDPAKEADAANALIEQGADVILQHTDSTAPQAAAQEAGNVITFGQASDMADYAPMPRVSSIIDDWAPYYIERVGMVLDGTWEATDTWKGIASGMVKIGDYNNVPEDVAAQADAIKNGIVAGTHHPFTGPIKKQDGSDWLAEGETADDATLAGMNFYVEGLKGDIPQ